MRGVEVIVHRTAEAVEHRRIAGARDIDAGRRRPPEQCVETFDRARGGSELGRTEVGGAAVVGLEHGQAQRAPVVVGQRVLDGGEVAERLRHLVAADRHHAGVDPVAGERVAGSFRLRPLVLVVREREVLATAVEVETLPQQVERHGRALDVPTGTTLTPR